MTRSTLALTAFAIIAGFTANAHAGSCSKGYGGYGGGHYDYKPAYKTCYKPTYVRPVYKHVEYVKPVIVEKPVYVHRPVVIEKPVCVPCKLPSLGFFGVICPEGMLVKEVMPNSEACRLGLAPGDVIKMFDDIRIICDHDWEHALECAGPVACLKVIPCGCHEIVIMHAHLAVGCAR